jgi:hypothetical protein
MKQAAAAVCAAVDAAAETAYKTLFTNATVMEHAAGVKTQRLLEKMAEQEQRNSTQDDVIFKMKHNVSSANPNLTLTFNVKLTLKR